MQNTEHFLWGVQIPKQSAARNLSFCWSRNAFCVLKCRQPCSEIITNNPSVSQFLDTPPEMSLVFPKFLSTFGGQFPSPTDAAMQVAPVSLAAATVHLVDLA